MAELELTGDSVVDTALDPLRKHFKIKNVEDICINRPGELEILVKGDFKLTKDANLTLDYWINLARILASYKGLPWSEALPRVSCQLPGGHRFEVMGGTGVENGVSGAIRVRNLYRANYGLWGITAKEEAVIKSVVAAGGNIVLSGATGTGKTTLANLMLESIPPHERVCIVEDTPEFMVGVRNQSRFIVPRNAANTDADVLTYPIIFDHLMRIRPDRTLLGELSITNSYPALRFLNSGHGGFITTVHATSIKEFINRSVWFNINFKEPAPNIAVELVAGYLEHKFDLAIQLVNVRGKRQVSELVLPSQGMKYLIGDGNALH